MPDIVNIPQVSRDVDLSTDVDNNEPIIVQTETNKKEEPKVVTKECRFAQYIEPPERGKHDLHVVKEILHMSDGSTRTNILQVPNYKRPFYLTKTNHRNHEDKKEWEDLDKLNKYMSRECDMPDYITRLLNTSSAKGNKRKANTSQFVYGSDITSTALVKQTYIKKYTEKKTPYTVSVLDTETDVLHGTKDVIMATFSFKSVCVTACLKSFLANVPDPHKAVEDAMTKYLGDVVEKRQIKPTLILVDTPREIIVEIFRAIHKHRPDFLTFWNMEFDIEVILKMCEKYNLDPKEVFSDPSVPKEYKYFKWKPGAPQKVTASGKVKPYKVHERWHTLYTPSSYYCIDAMCAYKQLRLAKAELPNYKLDYVLNLELKRGKLNFKEADHITNGLLWHQFMQKNYPVEYVIYNRFDCISIEMLDERTNDLSVSLPLYSGCSDFQFFNSQPRRIVDDLHNFVLEKHNKVIGSTGQRSAVDEDNDELFDLRGLIITLPAHLIAENKTRLIREYPDLVTNIFNDVADLDVSAAYPRGQIAFNISKETTKKEVISIEGIDEYTYKMQNINLSGGATNALEYCQTMFLTPTLPEMLELFNAL